MPSIFHILKDNNTYNLLKNLKNKMCNLLLLPSQILFDFYAVKLIDI